MYLDYFKLEEPPFDFVPQANFFYWTDKQRASAAQIVNHLLYKEGHAVLLGEVDGGKTQFVKTLLEGLPAALKKTYVYQVALGGDGLVGNICRQLGLPFDEEGIGEIEVQLLQFLQRGRRKNRKILFVIDNAERLQEIDLELLDKIGAGGDGRLQILLVGRTQIESIIAARAPKSLRQSILLYTRLVGYNRLETQEYIEHRLKEAKCPRPGQVFSTEASDAIYALSAGIPCRINELCDRALTQGHKAQVRRIDVPVVLETKDGQLPIEAFVAL